MGKTPQRVVELLQMEIPGKISKNKFCIQTGINQNSIDKYMAGITEPTNVSLQKLADYFKVSVSWLRGDLPWSLDEDRAILLANAKLDPLLEELKGLNPSVPEREIKRNFMLLRARAMKGLSDEEKANLEKIVNGIFDFQVLSTAFMHIPEDKREEALEFLRLLNDAEDQRSARGLAMNKLMQPD